MRAAEVIATHGNTDFDAFAAMLAARLLYPGAVVAVGSLNRNVRDFYRLHADELGAITESSNLELDAIRRLVVIEAGVASRLGELEPVALDPAVEKSLFDHHSQSGIPPWVHEEAAVVSTDGALTTTLVGILAEREISPTPLEAALLEPDDRQIEDRDHDGKEQQGPPRVHQHRHAEIYETEPQVDGIAGEPEGAVRDQDDGRPVRADRRAGVAERDQAPAGHGGSQGDEQPAYGFGGRAISRSSDRQSERMVEQPPSHEAEGEQ